MAEVFTSITMDELVNCIVDRLAPLLHREGSAVLIGKANELVTEKELCVKLGITAPTALKYRQKGLIPFLRIGNAIRYDLQKVISALEKSKVK